MSIRLKAVLIGAAIGFFVGNAIIQQKQVEKLYEIEAKSYATQLKIYALQSQMYATQSQAMAQQQGNRSGGQ